MKQEVVWYRNHKDIFSIYQDMQKYIESGWRVHTCLERECDVLIVYERQIKTMNDKRIKEALSLAWQYGQIDGDHHKTWVIDQMVRVLCGSNEEYNKWVEAYEKPLSDEEYYEWDTGIAP